MANFPSDQYDEIPTDLARVGAHRAPRRRRGGIWFAWAALATGVLVVAGVYGMSLMFPSIKLELPVLAGPDPASTTGPSSSAAPVVEPASPTTADPITPTSPLSISVFNGSATNGLQNTAGDALKDAGWSNPARANAANRAEKDTIVYYRSAEYEAIARGIVNTLGTGAIQLSDAFPGAPVTVVVAADYATIVG
ncbi:MAG TPA: LytR C-terminal domain-containing protein [Pseudolysinimonas sp.]|nr:LytR C-terminal domain-containing protein [Pseudolysinimonas sp.]